jgi:arginine-tRNA-protein transferase
MRNHEDQGIWPKFKGGYHMLHKIDDKLFAVGVLDFGPTSLSSVYLAYDPDYEFLSPGTLCALREIEYIKLISYKFD